MAKFSLILHTPQGNTVLTDYDTMAGRTAGLTFDETLNLNVDNSTLTFSMLKYLYEGSQKVVNTPAVSITYGSVIRCIMNQQEYDFAITEINYTFQSENVQLQFTAQDYFQFENSKIGVGYSISADTTDPSYLGAQPIDQWALKIIHDNNLRWSYTQINLANREWFNAVLSRIDRTWVLNPNIGVAEYWEYDTTERTLNKWVSFECSGTSAYGALKQLASDNGLMIMVDYSGQNFWFAPAKNPVFHGYYFNPNNNLQQFSVRGSVANLITVLNVTGPKDVNNQEITLTPNLPAEIVTLINSGDWANSHYYTGFYSQYTSDAKFLREAAYVPWLENKLINIDFFTNNHLLTLDEQRDIQEVLYDKLRIVNGKLMTAQQRILTVYAADYADINKDIIDAEAIGASLNGDVDTLYNLLFSDTAVCFVAKDANNVAWAYVPEGYNYYVNDILVTDSSVSAGGALYGKVTNQTSGGTHYKRTSLKILTGNLTIYGKAVAGIVTSNTITNKVVLDDAQTGPYVFTSLSTLLNAATNQKSEASTAQIDMLNQLCGTRDQYMQSFAAGASDILSLWTTYPVNESQNVGYILLKFRQVSTLADQDPATQLQPGDLFYNNSTEAFTSEDIALLTHIVYGAEGGELTRLDVIHYIAQTSASLTEAWDKCFAAATGLGLYWPKTWDVIDWLKEYWSLAQTERELVNLLSPIIPVAWGQPTFELNNLMPNVTLFPFDVGPYITKCDTLPSSVSTNPSLITSLTSKAKTIQVLVAGRAAGTIGDPQGTHIDFEDAEISGAALISQGTADTTINCPVAEDVNFIIHISYLYNSITDKNELKCWTDYHDYVDVPVNLRVYLTAWNQQWSCYVFESTDKRQVTELYTQYIFKDRCQVVYDNFTATVTDNTELRPQLITTGINDINDSFSFSLYHHSNVYDNLQLYKLTYNYKIEHYIADLNGCSLPAKFIAQPLPNPSTVVSSKTNPWIKLIISLSQRLLDDSTDYYTALQAHNEQWQHLYQYYPGVFLESHYESNTATNSYELYKEAQRELEAVCTPSFEYSLTGMDIYMHQSDFLPTRIRLGEQIRIDYQDPDQVLPTLNAALREPLYITGINHSLRNDGEYQFTVITRTAIDNMVKRFAQMLNFG